MARNLTVLNKGFTLIELLVVIGIMVLLSLLVTINWRGSQNNLALQRSAVKVSQDIKRTAELSLRGQPFSCATGSITGYGIYFMSASSSYIIFADCNNNQRYDAGPAGDGIAETLALEAGVVILAVSQNPLSIVFIPPDPAVWINQSQSPSASFTITLALQNNPSVTKSITINSKAVVSIQ